MVIVVGSGPAGVSAAKCLLELGQKVLMLDSGKELEPGKQALVAELSSQSPEDWQADHLNTIHSAIDPDVKGLPKKLLFGSDFPFQIPSQHLSLEQNGVDTLVSHAKGGLSNVWGANLLPFMEKDITNWPVTLEEFVPYYKKILDFVPLSATEDSLTQLLPLYTDRFYTAKRSKQAEQILSRLEKNSKRLSDEGFHFGGSRVALRVLENQDGPGCFNCGHCLYGCPYNLIYCSSSTLAILIKHPNFEYLPNYFVEHVSSSNDEVNVTATHLSSNKQEVFKADRIFVGAGAVLSSRIALESLRAFDTTLEVKESQYFLVPFLSFAAAGNVMEEDLHTLSQLTIALFDSKISDRSIHLMIYTYNDLYLRAIKKLLPSWIFKASRPMIGQLLSRLSVIQGYFHSDDSPSLDLKLSIDGADRRKLQLSNRSNPNTRRKLSQLSLKLLKNATRIGGVPLLPLAHYGAPGKSYHTGASMPMKASPSGFQTNRLGSLPDLPRVHFIDASVFTDIPATNITMTIMANAWRIAEECYGT